MEEEEGGRGGGEKRERIIGTGTEARGTWEVARRPMPIHGKCETGLRCMVGTALSSVSAALLARGIPCSLPGILPIPPSIIIQPRPPASSHGTARSIPNDHITRGCGYT